MSTATKRQTTKTNAQWANEERLPVSSELETTPHKIVMAAAQAGERSFSAQVRIILREWAQARQTS